MMPVVTFDELNFLLMACFIFGLILGAVYQLFRMVRFFIMENTSKNVVKVWLYRIGTFFLDVLFCLLVTFSAVVLFSSYGGGQVRIDGVACIFFGLMLWNETLGKLTYRVAFFLKKWASCVAVFIYRHTLHHVVSFIKAELQVAIGKWQAEKRQKYHFYVEKRLYSFLIGENDY